MAKRIYLDYAAATPLDPRVKEVMEPFWSENFGNPGGLYEEGVAARKAVQEARRKIARELDAKEDEIIFTASGTESCNLAILGVARAAASSTSDVGRLQTSDVFPAAKPHLITSKIEHHAVLRPFRELEKEGFKITYLEVGEDGIVNPEDLKKALRPETILVSVMYANNEIGTIQPLKEIGEIIKDYKLKTKNQKLFFHTDACQAAGYLDLKVNNLGIDLMSFSGYKFYGPKGIGFLYKSRKIEIEPPILGGEQEFGLRPGTEAVPLIIGTAKALELSRPSAEENERLAQLRDYFILEILKKIPGSVLNGHPSRRLPANVSISFKNMDNEELVLRLDAEGVAVATGSACRRESRGPSHVILALGREPKYAKGAIRFSLGRSTNRGELERVLEILPKLVLR